MSLLPFAQLDLAGELAPADGRYVVRPPAEPDAEPDVLVLRTLGAARARTRLRRGRPVPLPSEPDPAPLRVSRVTLVKAIQFDDSAEAGRWLDRVCADRELAKGLTAELVQTLNRALSAHRVAAPNRYVADLHPSAALAVRFGFGTGEQLADGRWSAASELSERARRGLRTEIIDGVGAQERIAAVLGGRDEIAPHEELLVGAERAADQGRPALAALTLATALESLTRAGGDAGEAQAAAGALRERALSGAEIDPIALREALRAGRRAIRGRSRS